MVRTASVGLPDLGERLLFIPVPRVRPLVLQQLTIGLHSFLVCGFRRALTWVNGRGTSRGMEEGKKRGGDFRRLVYMLLFSH